MSSTEREIEERLTKIEERLSQLAADLKAIDDRLQCLGVMTFSQMAGLIRQGPFFNRRRFVGDGERIFHLALEHIGRPELGSCVPVPKLWASEAHFREAMDKL